jgi:transcriptional regulator with XRE-family HTH domain
MKKKQMERLISELESVVKQHKLADGLQKNPRMILPLRLSLGMSQLQFLNGLNNPISQPTLIKYEKGNKKGISPKTSKSIADAIPLSEINFSRVWEMYKKFDDMKRGKYMTKERGQKLQKLWLQKTTKEQREKWGRKGALTTNNKQRLTAQENEIKNILNIKVPGNMNYKIHQQIPTDILSINIDFVVYKEGKPIYFIEATTRKHDLDILCQAYAYRKRLLAEKYPYSKSMIIIDELPSFAKRILESEFDFVFTTSQFRDFNLMASGQQT